MSEEPNCANCTFAKTEVIILDLVTVLVCKYRPGKRLSGDGQCLMWKPKEDE